MTLDLTKTAERFTLGFVPVLKAAQGPDGKRRLHGIASSTVQDRHGDIMSKSALEDMLEQSNRGLTIFLNHSYNVPEDVAGTVERASLRQTSGDIHDLSFDIIINEKNHRAVEAWEAISEQGTKLGLSIGAMIPEGGAKVDRKSGIYTIDHVDLVETSIVGVPANPRSWVEYAAKALRKQSEATSVWFPGSTTTNGANVSVTTWTGEPKQDEPEGETPVEPPMIEPTPDEIYEPPAAPVTTDDLKGKGPLSSQAEEAKDEKKKSADPKQVDEPEQDDKDEGETPVEPPVIEPVPDSPPPEPPVTTEDLLKMADVAGGKQPEPEKADATVTVETPFASITVDTGNRGNAAAGSNAASQEAQPSAPDTEGQATTAGAPWMGIPGMPPVRQDLDISSLVQKELQQSATTITKLTRELSTVTGERDDERSLRKAAERERDQLSVDLTRVLRETEALLQKLSTTPAGRRATYHEAVGRYEAIKSVYGEEITNTLVRSIE